jgi:hypothetical protein
MDFKDTYGVLRILVAPDSKEVELEDFAEHTASIETNRCGAELKFDSSRRAVGGGCKRLPELTLRVTTVAVIDLPIRQIN